MAQTKRKETEGNGAGPLAGRRVVVTRPAGQNGGLRALLEGRGAEVLELPLIRVVAAPDRDAVVEVFAELGSYDWIVFTSANGVRCFFDIALRAFEDIRGLGLLRFACVGGATAAEVEKFHIKVECRPEVATAEALAEALVATGSLDSAKVILVTGNLNRDALARRLEEARAIVDKLPLYRTERVDAAREHAEALAEFRRRGADAVLLASASAAESYAAQAGAPGFFAAGARRPLVGSIGAATGGALRRLGLAVDFEAEEPGLEALAEALGRRLSEG
ncbi:MAG: uroporphyrinogen-III synthase [Opitutaceae bacterium]|jgi:uroporphyrinogen III methyltransferase/synthase|nr:uroporphyrinogen-III synthase [Opitutaceae bacterium]